MALNQAINCTEFIVSAIFKRFFTPLRSVQNVMGFWGIPARGLPAFHFIEQGVEPARELEDASFFYNHFTSTRLTQW